MNYAKNNCKNMDLINVSNAEIKEYYKATKDWKSYYNFVLEEVLEEYKDNESMLQLIKILSKHLHNYSNKDYINVSVERIIERKKHRITCKPYLKTTLCNYRIKIHNKHNNPYILLEEKAHKSCIDLYLNDINNIQVEEQYNGQQYHITFRYDDNVDYDMYVSNYDKV